MKVSVEAVVQKFVESDSSMFPKQGKQYSHIIRYLFENPNQIGKIFYKIGDNSVCKSTHQLDLNAMFKFYENINLAELNPEISKSLMKSLNQLENEGALQALLKDTDNLRFFFIVMLWDRLFLLKENNLHLLKFLNLLKSIGEMKKTLCLWLDSLPRRYLKMQVIQLLIIIEEEFKKLLPKAIEEKYLPIVNLNVENLCLFLQMLNESNQRNHRIASRNFVKANLNKYFRPVDIINLHLKGIKTLNFTRFPFILTLQFKNELLRIESLYEQRENRQKNLLKNLHNMIQGGNLLLDSNGEINLDNLAFLKIEIDRNNILEDSMEKIIHADENLKSPLRIKFKGEDGSDEGGVKKEYFQLLVKEIFNPYLDMFIHKNNSRVFWFNGFSFEPPIRFQFVGTLLALSIYNSVHLDVKLPKFLYKRLITTSPSANPSKEESKESKKHHLYDLLRQLQEIEPEVTSSMSQILNLNENVEAMELYFTIDLESFGQNVTRELVENGKYLKLTKANKKDYVYRYCEYLLHKHVEKQEAAFRRGFHRVVDSSLIHILKPDELEAIICGNSVIDINDLEMNTRYEGGYHQESQVIRWFWEILRKLNEEEKKSFLFFCTGSDRVPIDGLKSLKFMVQKNGEKGHLPTAQTCFNVFLLPEYDSYDKLEQSIHLVLKNNQGFGLI